MKYHFKLFFFFIFFSNTVLGHGFDRETYVRVSRGQQVKMPLFLVEE